MDIAAGDLETTKKYALSKGIGGILFIRDDKCIDIYNAVTGEVSSTSMNELLNK
jgi:ATP phosphoribosyltransferase regulatory subunit